MEDQVKLIGDVPAINRFLSYCRIRSVPSKTVLIHAGDLPDVLYYIISGSVEVMIEDEDGAKAEYEIRAPYSRWREVVLGDLDPSASVPGEIVPSREFYDYEAKYLDEGSKLLIPAPLSPLETENIRRLSIEMIAYARWGHPGGSLSMAELLAVLTGCVESDPTVVTGLQHRDGWASLQLRGGSRVYVQRTGGG
mgnify:CR=1 FL=1